MKKLVFSIVVILSAFCGAVAQPRQGGKNYPMAYKWMNEREAVFTLRGGYNGNDDYSVDAVKLTVKEGVKCPAKYIGLPFEPAGSVNPTFSPDSTKIAFTRDNNLWIADVETREETQLTYDGNPLILNGYASWVYYEEILGRPTRYKAFWWSPDSKKIGFYRFDNSEVPMFPIFSPFGQDGKLSRTRYPKAGEANPKVRIGIVDLASAETVWADFDENDDQYFGTPFWGADSKSFFISREPRIQNTLDLYSVSAADGSKTHIYHEEYDTWLDWIEGMIFTEKGLYMARSFETGWQQIYFLSYDGKTLNRLTNGSNWRIELLKVDEKKGDVYFTARRESAVRTGFYKVDKKGNIHNLTDADYDVTQVSIAPDSKHFVATLSNFRTPNQVWIFDTDKVASAKDKFAAKGSYKVADLTGMLGDSIEKFALPELVYLTTHDGFSLPGMVIYPKDFDPSKKYPVHVDIYGGPDTPRVRDAWCVFGEKSANQWWGQNGIIEFTLDCRAAGHNGRAGLDCIYRQLDVVEVQDFCEWAEWIKSLPYVNGDKIGVEGFSFGGTMTALLVMNHSDLFHYGIAGGGVYDWALYDTHYTERFMETPKTNPDGYAKTRVIDQVKNYPAQYAKDDASAAAVAPVMLMLTHGTGDDNVHFQNTLQLINELQRAGKAFEFMIYPDGMHGYGGYQGAHDRANHRAFWLKYLKN